MRSANPQESNHPLVGVVGGTHAAGKTTLSGSFEQGKIHNLLGEESLYEDLGYGIIDLPSSDRSVPLIYVPESARWCGDYSSNLELLGKDWNLEFQLQVDAQYMLRAQTAIELAPQVAEQLLLEKPELAEKEITRPFVLSDRSVLEGLAYSRLRATFPRPEAIGGFPRTKFFREWVARYVDLAFLSDHADIPFTPDSAQSNDPELRENVAVQISDDYHSVLPPERIYTLYGSHEERRDSLLRAVSEHI